MTFDRIASGVCMVLAGPLILAGMLTSVWETDDSAEAYLRTYLVDPTRSQVSAVLLHLGFAMLVPSALGLAMVSPGTPTACRWVGLRHDRPGYVARPSRGRLLQPGPGAHSPIEQAVRVEEQLGTYPGMLVIAVPTVVGVALSFVLLAAAAWRVGFAP